jgi:hypothetical protein
MSDRISPCKPEGSRTGSRKQRPDLKVIRVAVGSFFVGEIHLDAQNRVRRRADTVPSDIVLKVLVKLTRQGDTCGKLVGRKDGREFYWYVVGNSLPDLTDVTPDGPEECDAHLELAGVGHEAA